MLKAETARKQYTDIRNSHFYTLRHTFATRCIEVGFDVKSLSEILGHANVSITLNRYVRDRRKFCVIDVPRQYENHRLSQE